MSDSIVLQTGVTEQEEKFIVDNQEIDKDRLSEMKRQKNIRLIQESPTKFRTLKRMFD